MIESLKVKICGITRREDAQLASELGASAVGYILSDSPRQISLLEAASISQILPPYVLAMGVFVNPSIDFVREAVAMANLTGIQLHGTESPEFVKKVKHEFPMVYLLKALEPLQLPRAGYYECDGILVDPPRSSREPLDINTFNSKRIDAELFIAGGLNSQNVGTYIETVRPDGIDVSSGIESAPGIKDPTKLQKFFAAVDEAKKRAAV